MTSSDLILTLRERAADCPCVVHCDDCELAYAAADKIERLEEIIVRNERQYRAAIIALKNSALDSLAKLGQGWEQEP